MKLKLKREYGKLEDYILERPNSYINAITREEKDAKSLPLPTFDCAFKRMFATESTKKFACLLLGTVLDIDIEMIEREMVLIRNEMGPDYYGGRTVRMDFVGKVDDVIFNIEMNQNNQLERNIDYANKLYTLECREGMEKYESVFQMNINNFKIEGQEETIAINVMKGKRGRRSKLIVVDVYLPNINELYRKGANLKEGEKTILWMFIGDEEEMKKIGGENEYMKSYLKELKRYAKDEEAMKEYYEECDSAIAGRERGIEEGIIKGREEGIEIGEEKNKIETATTMLKKGLEPKLVQECTKLSLEKISNIMALL